MVRGSLEGRPGAESGKEGRVDEVANGTDGVAGLLGAGVLVATIAPAGAQTPLSVTVCHTQDIGLIDPARGVLLNELNNLWVNIYETLGLPGAGRAPRAGGRGVVGGEVADRVGVQDPARHHLP